MIYLDHNATSPYSESVKKFIREEMVHSWANPSSEHALGAVLGDEISLIRSTVAEILGCSSRGLVFNSGATESINTILSEDNLNAFGVKRIISSAMEHHATLDRLKYLESRGWSVVYVENNREGQINREHLITLLQDSPKALVSILFANNETGVINPIKDFSQLANERGHLIHVDAVQALGKIRFSLNDLDVDFASFSGHKIGSLKGVGILYVKDIKKLKPIIHGGGQERGYRPGTLNYSGIKSLKLAMDDINESAFEKMLQARRHLENELKSFGCLINCENTERLPNTISVMIPHNSGREILFQLSRKNIHVSTGSACSSGSFEPSHVLTALGFTKNESSSCIRTSLGAITSQEDIIDFCKNFEEIIKNSQDAR